jgi:hypothetical protein
MIYFVAWDLGFETYRADDSFKKNVLASLHLK